MNFKTKSCAVVLVLFGIEILYIASNTSVISRTFSMIRRPNTRSIEHQLTNHTNSSTATDIFITKIHSSVNRYVIKPIKVESVNCEALFSGDIAAINATKKRMKYMNQKEDKDKNATIDKITNCKSYRRDEGYIMSELTDKEANFSIAYSIIMYKNFRQFEHLLKTIYRPQNLYCIHVDLKSSFTVYKAVHAVSKCFPNVFIPRNRIPVVWGTMSALEVELMCMKELFRRNINWKYFINLTGQEFPLKTNAELVDILEAFNGSNNIVGVRSKNWEHRFNGSGVPPHGLKPAKGSLHIIASRGFVEFVLTDPRAGDYRKWANRTTIPDETFFSTLNLSPSLTIPGSYKYEELQVISKPLEKRVMRFKQWAKKSSDCKGGKSVRHICILGIDYLPKLRSTETLFANKFDWNYDHIAIQCLGELLYNRTRDEYHGRTKFNASWYSSLDFVVNKI